MHVTSKLVRIIDGSHCNRMAATGFTLIKLFELGTWSLLWQGRAENLGYHLFIGRLCLFGLSLPLAIIGTAIDKRKRLSIYALVAFLRPLWLTYFGNLILVRKGRGHPTDNSPPVPLSQFSNSGSGFGSTSLSLAIQT
jgi:hypothetical protein